jgi:exopolysaccharide biosynthesis polyprenyl glycosylphosphotransferase
MLSLRIEIERLRLELGDGLVAAACLLIAVGLRGSDLLSGASQFGPFQAGGDLYLSAAIAGLASTHTLRWCGAYANTCNADSRSSRGTLIRGWASGGLMLAGAGLLFGLQGLSLTLIALFAPIHLAGLTTWRLLEASWLRGLRRRNRRERTFVVIGSDERARRVAERLTADWGLRNLGFLDDSPVSIDVEAIGERYLGSSKELARLIRDETIDEVFVVLPRQRLGDDSTVEAIRLCELVGLDVTVSSDFFEAERAQPAYHEALGTPALSFRSYQLPPLWALAVKRVIDVVGATLALVVSSPLWLAAALAIKLDSPGPIFFVQRRCGLYGRTFPFLKFRTMSSDAEERFEALRDRNELSGPVFKIKDDPRVTLVGRFLRKYSIDELPQLLNVLQGDMSLVGPRPPTQGEVRQYEPFQRRRLSLRPGLTCLWQVSGRNLLSFDDWVKLDLQYIDEWSLRQDLKIMVRTIPAVLSGRGAS